MYLPDRFPNSPPDSSNHHQLRDGHGRVITYLRLAITDRCNLRCNYCMPREGIRTLHHDELLTYEEMERVVAVFLDMGINKVRITGGEPFTRKGCVGFLERLKKSTGVENLFITTNGVETARYLDRLAHIRLSGINLSIDSLERSRFKAITGRDKLNEVLESLYGALERNIAVKINSVVTPNSLDEDVLQVADLARKNALQVRFVEVMPFSGSRSGDEIGKKEALSDRIRRLFPSASVALDQPLSTARIYSVPGFIGTIGIIRGYSRSFCSTCNKVRVTPPGILKNCLYDGGVLDLKTIVRDGVKDSELMALIRQCVRSRHANGVEAQKSNDSAVEPSMSAIGG